MLPLFLAFYPYLCQFEDDGVFLILLPIFLNSVFQYNFTLLSKQILPFYSLILICIRRFVFKVTFFLFFYLLYFLLPISISVSFHVFKDQILPSLYSLILICISRCVFKVTRFFLFSIFFYFLFAFQSIFMSSKSKYFLLCVSLHPYLGQFSAASR